MKRVYRGMAISRYWRLRLKPWQLRVWITVALILKWAGCTQFRDQPLAGIYRPRINASPRASANTPPGYIYDANIAPTARKLFHHLVEDSLQWDSCWMDGKPRVLFRIVCLCVSFPFFFFFLVIVRVIESVDLQLGRRKREASFDAVWECLIVFEQEFQVVTSEQIVVVSFDTVIDVIVTGGEWWVWKFDEVCELGVNLSKKKKKSGGSRSNWNNFAD